MRVDSVRKSCHTRVESDHRHDMPRGGYRENAGRKLAVGDKLSDDALQMDFTPEGHKVLADLVAVSGLSRNQVLSHLAKTYAPRLEFPKTRHDDGRQQHVHFTGKAGGTDAGLVMRIRMPQIAVDRIRAAQRRTKHGVSDIGEGLVRWFGPKEKQWPIVPGRDRRRSRKA